MTDYNEDKTVIVDRDRADRSSPVGWIVLLLALVLIVAFLLMGGTRLFGGDTTDDTGTSTEGTNTPVDVDVITPDPAPEGGDSGDSTQDPSQ